MIKLIIQNGEAFNAFWNQVSHSKSVLSLLPSQVESKKSSGNSMSVMIARQKNQFKLYRFKEMSKWVL